MTTFKVEETDQGVYAHFRSSHINKRIKCPDKRAKKVKGVYYPEKNTILKYHIPVLHVDGKEKSCHDLLLGRVWNTLWEEGWRIKNK